jgi:hypothetical protein
MDFSLHDLMQALDDWLLSRRGDRLAYNNYRIAVMPLAERF